MVPKRVPYPGHQAIAAHLQEHPEDVERLVTEHLRRPMPDHVLFALFDDMARLPADE